MITTNERQERLIDAYGELINPAKAKLMRAAGLGIIEERKSGAYVWDQDGTRYIDCRDDTCIYNVGRKNKDLVHTLQTALQDYDLGNNRFFSEPRIHLARKLGAISPAQELTGVAYGVSGGEINDFAIKLARAITGRSKVISMKGAEHGSTGYALSASATRTQEELFGPLIPGFVQVPFGDAAALASAIDTETACVILEPIQGWAGVRSAKHGYLREVRQLCLDNGALMIADEIETGLGRTGKMFAIDHEAVVPDIMTIGNSLSGGLFPMTAALLRPEYLKFWKDHPYTHHSTFGGSDLGCIVGLETLNWIEKNRLTENANTRGEELERGFSKLKKKYPQVLRSFRRVGLLMACEFTSPSLGPQMSRDLSQFGVLASHAIEKPELMRITPSLTLTADDTEVLLSAFDRALAGCQSIVVPMDPDVLSDLIRSFQRT